MVVGPCRLAAAQASRINVISTELKPSFESPFCWSPLSVLLTLFCFRAHSPATYCVVVWCVQLWPAPLVAALPCLQELVREALQYQGLDQDVSAQHRWASARATPPTTHGL